MEIKKSPENWECDGVEYLSVDDQVDLDFHLLSKLPYNHYCRKMVGYLKAIKDGADVIVDTDDDNIPYTDWAFPEMSGVFNEIDEKAFVNIYQYFSDMHIWPRGLPLNLIKKKFNFKATKKEQSVGIWQGLADEDPDVDAIYRLVLNEPCYFEKKDPIVLTEGTISPFNSQNTMFIKDLFPLLYLPSYVTFRFTDILRGLVAQPIMWLYGYRLGITEATVIQKRNEHDFFKDFESEIPCYIEGDKVIELVSNAVSKENSITDNLKLAYNALFENGIVVKEELELLDDWIKDINSTL